MLSKYAQQYRDLWNRHWWWQSRRRFVRRLIHEIASKYEIESILDVGCGDGLFFDDLMKVAPTWGIEPDGSLLSDDNPYRDRITVGDFASPIGPSRRYDLIVLLDVLEHIEDDRKALETLNSRLEPGGHVILTVPALQFLWSIHDDVNRHYRRYTRRLLRERLQEQNFQVVRIGYYFGWTVGLLLLRRLLSPGRSTALKEMEYRVPIPSPLVNGVLRAISGVDHSVAQHLPLPVGSSLFAVCRRPMEH